MKFGRNPRSRSISRSVDEDVLRVHDRGVDAIWNDALTQWFMRKSGASATPRFATHENCSGDRNVYGVSCISAKASAHHGRRSGFLGEDDEALTVVDHLRASATCDRHDAGRGRGRGPLRASPLPCRASRSPLDDQGDDFVRVRVEEFTYVEHPVEEGHGPECTVDVAEERSVAAISQGSQCGVERVDDVAAAIAVRPRPIACDTSIKSVGPFAGGQ